MEGLSRKEQQLSDALLDLGEDAMVLVELDGFVAGILVCPEMIPPSDWLPLVWNSEGGSDPVFEDLAHANKVMGLVMEYYNQVALALFEQSLAGIARAAREYAHRHADGLVAHAAAGVVQRLAGFISRTGARTLEAGCNQQHQDKQIVHGDPLLHARRFR